MSAMLAWGSPWRQVQRHVLAIAGACRTPAQPRTCYLQLWGAVDLAASHVDLPRTEQNSTQGMPVRCRLDASPACQQHVLVSPGRALGGTQHAAI